MKSVAKEENTILRAKRKLDLKNENLKRKNKMRSGQERAAKAQIITAQALARLNRKKAA